MRNKIMCGKLFDGFACLLTLTLVYGEVAIGGEGKPRPPEWERVLASARKEGKIVIGIPPSADLRREMEKALKQKFGLEAELVSAPGPRNASRIAAERKAGVRYFDALVVGTGTAVALAHDGMLEAIEPFLILPEVKDPKEWWGGHIWEDNVSTHRYLYSFLAEVSTGGLWYNSDLAKAEELRSLDDYLAPKWKGKIGFGDPRVPGSGQSIWSFMWEVKGEEYLKKLVQQELFLSRDPRQLTDALSKGKVALTFGIGRSQVEPFIKAGLPVKPAPAPKEGLPASNSFGVLGIVKDAPHPNAAKTFVNWLLSREGQEWYGKVMQNASRRLDVDTKWLKELGVEAAKDVLSLQEYHRVRNHLEDKYTKVRVPAGKFAETILK
ncbi:MAG TPA: extracellular solute-binding protein [Candidatus Binatia bacterium]|nr:extracellular solute-binding protein [Candidatus Binatia bacterium]